MHIQSNIIHQDDASATMKVEIRNGYDEYYDVFIVTVDKILGTAVAHSRGITKHTRLSFLDADDTESLESGAVQAALSFGE